MNGKTLIMTFYQVMFLSFFQNQKISKTKNLIFNLNFFSIALFARTKI